MFSFLLASNSTPNRQVDIHHTVIDISVDLYSEKVSGKVSQRFSPLGTSLTNFDLDAEDMVIRSFPIFNPFKVAYP